MDFIYLAGNPRSPKIENALSLIETGKKDLESVP